MYKFLKSVVLSCASVEIREEALNLLIKEVVGHVAVGTEEMTIPISPITYAQIRDYMLQGKKIRAIQSLKAETGPGLGLREAKEIVESISERDSSYPKSKKDDTILTKRE